jgi:hypothetical protein
LRCCILIALVQFSSHPVNYKTQTLENLLVHGLCCSSNTKTQLAKRLGVHFPYTPLSYVSDLHAIVAVHPARREEPPHDRNLALCRVLGALPSAFYRALNKEVFAECRTRQSPALGNDRVYQEQDSWHRNTLGEWRRSVKGRQQPSIADGRYLYRAPSFGTRQRSFFVECFTCDTRHFMLCRVPFLNTRQSTFLFFLFSQPNFLWYVPTLCRPTCTILAQL